MKKAFRAPIVIIHFQPLELYPPVTNLIKYLEKNAKENFIIISNKKKSNLALKEFKIHASNFLFIRTGIKATGLLARLCNYFLFYFRSFLLLIRYKPASILYFETLSAAPGLLYKKIFNNKVKLMAHYHEYTTPQEYDQNMRLSKWSHNMEKRMYRKSFQWISHTNEVRMQKFKADNNLENADGIHFGIMPNYPPQQWIQTQPTKSRDGEKHKLVYVGAVGISTMYLAELLNWAGKHADEVSLDIYSYNIEPEAAVFITKANFTNVKFHGGAEYEDLPGILKNYDVGLVIYKPYSENMIHNSSNKVFEYFACGLDVWFSKDMSYTYAYKRDTAYPKILPVDFAHLENFDFKTALWRKGLPFEPSAYYYENIYEEVYKEIKSIA